MDLGLQGRTALVGGASRGLGYAIARCLAEEGCTVIVCSRDEERIRAAAERIRTETAADVFPRATDLGDAADIDQLLAEVRDLGGADILVTNTGGPPPGGFETHDDNAWEDAFHGSLMSVIRLCRGVLPHMRRNRWGRILCNTSFTVKEPADNLILSNVFRVGVVALSKSLSREVAAEGITVNTICPGAFDTPRLQAVFRAQAEAEGRSEDAVRVEWEKRIPIGRVQHPDELASLVAFLASPRAAAITGTTIPVDGGMLRGLF